MNTPLDHINFSKNLPVHFVAYMKKTFGISVHNVCYKLDENEQLSNEAKLVMTCYKTYEDCNAKALALELKTLTLQHQLASPNCFWNEDDEDGPTFETLDSLAEHYRGTFDTPHGLITVGRSVEVDKQYIVIDYKNNSIKAHSELVSAADQFTKAKAHHSLMNVPLQLNVKKRKK